MKLQFTNVSCFRFDAPNTMYMEQNSILVVLEKYVSLNSNILPEPLESENEIRNNIKLAQLPPLYNDFYKYLK